MENTPSLYDTLVVVLRQHRHGRDLRHLTTLAGLMVGLIHSYSMRLCAWAPLAVSRAQYRQSTVRRFRRWLDNDKIDVPTLYGPRRQQALGGWCGKRRAVALETSLWWETSGIVRLAVIDRGRAVPLVWRGIEHGSAPVAQQVDKELLDKAAALLPRACKVVLLADRGCADTRVMGHLQRLGWPLRLRITSNVGGSRPGGDPLQGGRSGLGPGHARLWHPGWLPQKSYGPVPVAAARPWGSPEYWQVVSDEPTDGETLQEDGLRFEVEEHVLEDTSNGLQLESSLSRSAKALARLCFV